MQSDSLNLNALDRKRDELAEKHPGWKIWYVPHVEAVGGSRVVWCAQPKPLLNEDSAEHLVEAIRNAEAMALAELAAAGTATAS